MKLPSLLQIVVKLQKALKLTTSNKSEANLAVHTCRTLATINIFQVLRLSKMSIDSGHVMELVCNDSQRIIFTSAEWFIPYAIRHILYIACVIAWLLYFIGWYVIPGALFLLALSVIRGLLKVDYQLRQGSSRLSDKRLGAIRETLSSVRSLKLNCWEEIYEEKIRKTRW